LNAIPIPFISSTNTAVSIPTSTSTPPPVETSTVSAPTAKPTVTRTPVVVPTKTLPPVVNVTGTTPPGITPADATSTPGATPLGGGFGQIAFASARSGLPQIYLVNEDGTDLIMLTNVENGACQPTWSPDGSRLAFVSPCRARAEFFDTSYKDSSLYAIHADGTGLEQLTAAPGSDFDPAWSPDGKRIAFTSLRDGKKDIYLLTLDTGAIVRLTTVAGDVQENSHPAWSPSGNQIAYTVKRVNTYQVWAMSDIGADNAQLARSGQQLWDYLPVWSPDGATVVFNQRNPTPTRPWLMSIRYEDRDIKDPTRLELPRPIEDVEFSQDGLWLVFESMDNEGNRDIYFMTLIGGNRTRLTNDPAVDFDPTWRPAQNP